MLDKEKDKNVKVPLSLIVTGSVVFLLIIFAFATNKPKEDDGKLHYNLVYPEKAYDIMSLVNKMGDNYTLSVDSPEMSFDYSTDGNLKLYNEKSSNIGYITYKNNTYLIDENFNVSKSDKPDFIKNPLGNIKYIIESISDCDFKDVDKNNVSCNIPITKYLVKYDQALDLSLVTSSNGFVNVTINYDEPNINYFKVDYSTFNKEVLKREESLIYMFSVSSVGNNDYNDIYSHFKSEISR